VTRTGDAYAYTGSANTNTGYTSNGLNQQVSIGGSTATWDSNGNLTSGPQSAITYTYDAENELTSETGSPLGGANLGYDPLNRLDTYNPGSTRRFVYDGKEAVAELDSTGAIQNRYVRGDVADELLVDYSGSGTSGRRFTSVDERGSIISLTDSSGNLIGIDRYDEFGNPQSTNIGRFQYTGQAWLPEIGMQFSKARSYAPTLGTFGQTDPAETEDSPNLYQYGLNDPVNHIDPSGRLIDVPIIITAPVGLSNLIAEMTDIDNSILFAPFMSGGGFQSTNSPADPDCLTPRCISLPTTWTTIHDQGCKLQNSSASR